MNRPRPAPRSIGERFLDQLSAALPSIRPGTGPRLLSEREWASATFAGRRLVIALDGAGDRAEDISARLAEREFTLPGHFVADIAADIASQAESGAPHLAVLILKEA